MSVSPLRQAVERLRAEWANILAEPPRVAIVGDRGELLETWAELTELRQNLIPLPVMLASRHTEAERDEARAFFELLELFETLNAKGLGISQSELTDWRDAYSKRHLDADEIGFGWEEWTEGERAECVRLARNMKDLSRPPAEQRAEAHKRFDARLDAFWHRIARRQRAASKTRH